MDGRQFLSMENLTVDLDERLAVIDNQQLDLNRKEMDILIFLMMNKNRIIRKTAIAENIWGDYIDQANDFDFIYSQIKNLRKKLRDYGARVEINTVYGMGYKLTPK
jgi:DNA-binding response OmpR family regulator